MTSMTNIMVIQIVKGLVADHVAARMSRKKTVETALRFEYLFCLRLPPRDSTLDGRWTKKPFAYREFNLSI